MIFRNVRLFLENINTVQITVQTESFSFEWSEHSLIRFAQYLPKIQNTSAKCDVLGV